jgi:hypothetical protein
MMNELFGVQGGNHRTEDTKGKEVSEVRAQRGKASHRGHGGHGGGDGFGCVWTRGLGCEVRAQRGESIAQRARRARRWGGVWLCVDAGLGCEVHAQGGKHRTEVGRGLAVCGGGGLGARSARKRGEASHRGYGGREGSVVETFAVDTVAMVRDPREKGKSSIEVSR